MKRIILALVAIWAFVFAGTALAETQAPLQLRIFVYDRCGGCGADGPGCGDCDELARLHAIVKDVLGDKLYDGSLDYTMPNCRMLLLLEEYEQYIANYHVYDELYGIFPAAFVLRSTGDGVFLIGEDALHWLDEVVEALERGDRTEEVQAWIDARLDEAQSLDID